MAIDTQGRQGVIYFTGTEVEHTPMHGQPTLFVVGVQPVDEIVSRAQQSNIKHIYLGTSQSFTPSGSSAWKKWDQMISGLLDRGLVVSLDFGVEYAENILEFGWCESNNFIPMISVKLPYIKLFNYNATLKIDDTTWGHSNPGVWCHSLNKLMDRSVYTDWNEYVGDTPLNG